MADLTSLLLAAQDPSKRPAAEASLVAAEQKDAAEYFVALSGELASNEKPVIARQLSGILIKNGLWAKSVDRDMELKQRYAAMPDVTRQKIKDNVLLGLGAPDKEVAKAAAQVLAKVGAIEVPALQWPQLIPLLLQHVTGGTDQGAKTIALTTLGYLCEELVPLQEQGQTPVADEQCNQILTAVVQGMREPDHGVKLEATKAFYHAIVLAQKNFRNERERNFIMQVIHDTCKCTDAPYVQIAAFECLVQIATEFYDFLTPYMNAVGPLTWETIKSAPENVAIPAMEFWSTICDEELYLNEMAASGGRVERHSQNLIRQAVPFLVPLLTETLGRQESEEEEDTWNLAMAAGTCLSLVAQVAGNDCVDQVLAFVNMNFTNPDWKFREAAVLAYGSIMEGPSSEKMAPLVQESFSQLVQHLNDSSIAVRDTIAWTIGRIAQFHWCIVAVLLKPLMPVLLEKLKDKPRVAANICWVISVLSEQQQPQGLGTFQEMTPLSEFFTMTVQALLATASRPDTQEKQLGMKSYNALCALVLRAGNDCLGHMEMLVQEILLRLKNSFGCLDKDCELQGLLCGVLQALTQRLKIKILPAADPLMEEYLKVFEAYRQVKGGANVIHEEALLAVSALASAVEMNFERFMPHFVPCLHMALQNYEDTQVCLMAVGVVTDLCRALQMKVLPYVEQFVHILYTNLQNPKVDRKIKAAIMTTFGDISLAITGEFEKFLAPILGMLQEASMTRLEDGPPDNEDWIDYLNSLREGVLEAYAGIIHGLRESNKIHLFKEHVNGVLDFVRRITDDNSASDDVMKQGVCVVGDLIMVFQHELTMYLSNAPFLPKLVKFAAESTDPGVRQHGGWLQTLLNKYRPQG